MAAHKWVLLALVLALLVYELLALTGMYPTITATVSAWPLWLVFLVALGLGVAAVHFVRAHDRRRR